MQLRMLVFPLVLLGCERADHVEPTTSQIDIPTETSPAIAQQPRFDARVREAVPPPPPRSVTLPPHLRWYYGLSVRERQEVGEVCRIKKQDPCAGMVPRQTGREPEPITALYANLGDKATDASDFCEKAQGPGRCDTPLVIAFDAQPIVFAAATGATFAFSPGAPAATDWPTAATPWIALDRDGDGAITSGGELFGDSTAVAGGTARNGFEALAALDANHDGVIDRRDPAFAKLLLWSDRDGDRRSSPSELRPLSEMVTAIPLANHVDVRCTDRHACEGERGIVQWRDATGAARTGAVVDVYLPRR